MKQNVEIKAKVDSLSRIRNIIELELKAVGEEVFQEDVFYVVRSGSLKLRKMDNLNGKLIFYIRSDLDELSQSDYLVYFTKNSDELNSLLSSVLGVKGLLRKHRVQFQLKNISIHLDSIENLGEFVEIEIEEISVTPNIDTQSQLRDLMKLFGIKDSDIIRESYIDLLEQ